MLNQGKIQHLWRTNFCFLLILISLKYSHSSTIKDIFTAESPLTRLPRDSKYSNRYGSSSGEKNLKPEDSPEARENLPETSVGKRCIRCDTGYLDRNPYDRSGYYDDRTRDYDRYDDRDRYYDRNYDRDRYSDRDRYYDRNDRYSDRDRDRYPDRSGGRDRYRDRYSDYDRYDPYDSRDRYDRYDRYDKYSDRGIGYDNRGYDYRGADRGADRGGYRPWDETYRGTSGFDSSGRGYYFASGRPEYGAISGYGSYGGKGYASGWNYGNSGSGRDDYYRDRGSGSYGTYRPNRDPYDGYRTTSYLYGRPSTTTIAPSSDSDSGNTQSPQDSRG